MASTVYPIYGIQTLERAQIVAVSLTSGKFVTNGEKLPGKPHAEVYTLLAILLPLNSCQQGNT